MRDLLTRTGQLAMLAGAALLVAGCSRGDNGAENNMANTLDANLMLEQPGNDQSAMESAANASEPVADTNNLSADSNNVLGDTSGGDTGGNTVDSNVSGM